jgi:NTP pyrophosphatase (non-canonical NTP hydrolase)
MMDLADLQDEHREWLRHNFPDQRIHQPLLGIMEEVGELAHAHLKHEQGIRGLSDQDLAFVKKQDAVGDIVIYLASYCTANNIDLDKAVRLAWHEVSNRDWVDDPEKGVPS